MIARRKTIAAIIAALVVATASYADMMPISRPDMEPTLLPVCERPRPQHVGPASSFISLGIAPWNPPSIELLAEPQAGVEQACETQSVQVLTDDHKSISLCLYALLSLGLCKSAPYVKKLSFGVIPEWYHGGGPFQIGHSVAISPDCLCHAPALCFVQPDCTVQDLSPQYYMGTIASLLRKSIFTPTVLAARGPPLT